MERRIKTTNQRATSGIHRSLVTTNRHHKSPCHPGQSRWEGENHESNRILSNKPSILNILGPLTANAFLVPGHTVNDSWYSKFSTNSGSATIIAYNPETQHHEAVATLEAAYIPRKQRTNRCRRKNLVQVTIKQNQESKGNKMEDYLREEGGGHNNRARPEPTEATDTNTHASSICSNFLRHHLLTKKR